MATTNPNSDVFAAMGALTPTQAFEGWTQIMGVGSAQRAAPAGPSGLAALDPTAAMIGGLELWRAAVNTQFNVAVSMLRVMSGSRR